MNLKRNLTFKRYLLSNFPVVSLLISGLLLFLSPLSAGAYDIVLGTGEVGTFSHFSGRILCRVITAQVPGVKCTTQAVVDDIDNLTNLQNGSLDLAIIDSQMLYGAATKSGVFQFVDISYDNLAILTPLYDLPIGIIVRKDASVATLNDLKGKRINGGAAGSLQRRTMDVIMKSKGWSESDFDVFEELPTSFSQDTMVFCHGSVQAMLSIGVHPAPSVQRLLENCRAELLSITDPDIDKLIEAEPALWKTEIEADCYPEKSRKIPTFGTRAILAASADMDQETAYAIVKALYTNQKRLQSGHPALSLYPVQEAQKGISSVKLHQGAAQFFSE